MLFLKELLPHTNVGETSNKATHISLWRNRTHKFAVPIASCDSYEFRRVVKQSVIGDALSTIRRNERSRYMDLLAICVIARYSFYCQCKFFIGNCRSSTQLLSYERRTETNPSPSFFKGFSLFATVNCLRYWPVSVRYRALLSPRSREQQKNLCSSVGKTINTQPPRVCSHKVSRRPCEWRVQEFILTSLSLKLLTLLRRIRHRCYVVCSLYYSHELKR